MSQQPTTEQIWHALLSGQFAWEKHRRRYGLFPAKHKYPGGTERVFRS